CLCLSRDHVSGNYIPGEGLTREGVIELYSIRSGANPVRVGGTHGGKVAAAHPERGEVGSGGLGMNLPNPIIIHKEEQPIAQDRSANVHPELIAVEGVLGFAIFIEIETVRRGGFVLV